MAGKARVWLKDKAMKAKEAVVPILVVLVPGLIVGGSLTALSDNRRIKRLEKRLGEHIHVGNNNVDTINAFMDTTNDRIEELTRQNNQLLEKALKETEGKAS